MRDRVLGLIWRDMYRHKLDGNFNGLVGYLVPRI